MRAHKLILSLEAFLKFALSDFPLPGPLSPNFPPAPLWPLPEDTLYRQSTAAQATSRSLAESLAAIPGTEDLGRAQVFIGNVPDTGEEELPERFPFAVIRWLEGESREEGENIEEIVLILGVFAPSGPGEAELITAALMDHLRLHFMQLRILSGVFDLQMPLTVTKPEPEKRQHNFHVATILTRWQHTTFQRPLQGDFDEQSNT